jgi:hypothetical protein
MELFTARPKRIIGNIALSSLYVGLPTGLITGLVSVIYNSSDISMLDMAKGIFGATIVLPVACFICALLLIAPALWILRRFDLGGPAFVYGISFFIGSSFFGLSLQGGFYVLAVAMACSYVFCKYAYQSGHELINS